MFLLYLFILSRTCVMYLMAICEKFSLSLFILFCLIYDMWVRMVSLLPVVMMMRGRIVHHCCPNVWCSFAYLSNLMVGAPSGNLSLQYVNLKILIVELD